MRQLPFKSFITQPSQAKSPFIPSTGSLPSHIKHPPRPTFSHGYDNDLVAYRNRVYDVKRNNGKEALSHCLDFGGNANHASFFYNDKFCVTSNKNGTVNVHKIKVYHHEGGKESISSSSSSGGGGKKEDNKEKIQPFGAQKTVSSFSHSNAQSVLAIACVNSALSHLIASSASDRSLKIFDVATGNVYWSCNDGCGNRAAHALALPNVSANVSLPNDCYCLLAACSTDNGGLVKLWDVRSGSPAAQFRGHVNRREVTNVSFSPCMRYLAAGSEEPNGAVLYDMRGGGIVEKIRGNRNVVKDLAVVDVQFNPIFPQLCTASLGGVVKFYCE